MIQAIHSAVRGRARYKVEELYRSPPLKEFIEKRLSKKKGIKKASASTLTANVLVLFDSGDSSDVIGSLIAELVKEYRSENGKPTSSPDSSKDLKGDETGFLPEPQLARRTSAPRNEKTNRPLEEQKEGPWHVMDVDSVLSELKTSRTGGLTSAEAKKRLKKFGPNLLPHSEPRSRLSIFIEQFQSLPVALLGIASGVAVLTGGIADAVVMLCVIGINASIGFVTESEAERTIEGLKDLIRPGARIIRDGEPVDIAPEKIVPGDLVVLTPGTYVPADCRLVQAEHLSIDESALTGEAMPVHKSCTALEKETVALADRLNMIYMGTLVTGGQGAGVAVQTGKSSEVGKLQLLVREAEAPETPLERELALIGNRLVLIGGTICGLVFAFGIIRGQGLLQMFRTSISLAVAAVPEGLPMVATTTLALGIRKMNRHHILIRNLNAVETLGAVQTICFDKTGTVTLNKMSVQAIYSGGRKTDVRNGEFISGDERIEPSESEELIWLIRACVLCNETQIERSGEDYILKGSSTEAALVNLAIEAGIDVLELKGRYPVIKIDHRSEDRHFMDTLHRLPSGGRLIAMKGSPLEVLAMCDRHLMEGKVAALLEEERRAIELENEHMAGRALRVLGFAYLVEEEGREEAIRPTGLIWLGLIGMADPIRPGIGELIGLFHRAGIDTIMLTGDQSPTAYAIARELRLSRGGPVEILDSMHFMNMDPDALRAISERVHVFARVSPAHKLQIVQALQQAGRIVAMTGDGINDSPALKAADIGIAMGHSGTDMAREVADVVVENDDLETMIIAVSHGRTIYSNIRKTLRFVLATNLSEILVMVAAGALGTGYPLNAMQLLWINLISDIFPGIALALDPPEPEVLSYPPRDPKEPIITKSDFKRIGLEASSISLSALGAYGFGLIRHGAGRGASTLAFQSLTLGQLLHTLSCRSEKHSIFDYSSSPPPNYYLRTALGGSLFIQLLTLFVPGLRKLLGSSPIDFLDGLVIGGSAVLPLFLNEAAKVSFGRSEQ